jgi:transcriptional regulator with XRE-family HTH domain
MTNLRAERERRGLSRAALARLASMGEGAYGQIESRRRVPYGPEIERISGALVLLGWSGSPSDLLKEVEQS